MRTWTRRVLAGTTAVAMAAVLYAAVITRSRAHELTTNPAATRQYSTRTPADEGLPFETVAVRSSDGLRLVGWYIPSAGRAAVILQHGYKDPRSIMLGVAVLLHRHGYGVLVQAVRAHDDSEGERISFGHDEIRDMAAWYEYLVSRPDIDPARIGIFGISMGGSLAIQFAAAEPGIRAVVADCAFSSLTDTVTTSVRFFTGLPAFPFAPMILFWTEREGGYSVDEIDAKRWIAGISPRPVFLLQGGADQVVSPESGRRLFDAAREPKELWFDPSLGHVEFLAKRPAEFERRVSGFFDEYLGR